MAKKRRSKPRDESSVQGAVEQQPASLEKSPTRGQLAFNLVLAIFGLFVAAFMFSLGVIWTNHGSMLAGIGLIAAGLFIFWRGGQRLSWTCAVIKMQRQK
jgi:hypothetical protein